MDGALDFTRRAIVSNNRYPPLSICTTTQDLSCFTSAWEGISRCRMAYNSGVLQIDEHLLNRRSISVGLRLRGKLSRIVIGVTPVHHIRPFSISQPREIEPNPV